MRLSAVGSPTHGLDALEQELLQLSAAKGRASTPRRLTLNISPGMSVTLRSPRGILHYSPNTGPGSLRSPGDYSAGGLLTSRLRLLEESISDETEMHRKLEVLGALAVRVNAASLTPSPEGAGDTAQRTSVMPVRTGSPTPSNGGSSQKLASMSPLPPRSSRSFGFPAYGQNENAMSMAVRDSDFCRLSLTPRDSIRVGHLQLQLKTAGVAQVYTVESLQRQNTQIREYNAALEDQLAGARAQVLALQSEVEAMRQGRHEYAKKLQRSPDSGENDGVYQSIQENKQIIADLKRRLAESEERERSRALSVAAEREERRHTEQEFQRVKQEKEELKQKEIKEREAAVEAAQARAKEEEEKAKAREEKSRTEEEAASRRAKAKLEVAAEFEDKARRREQAEEERIARREQAEEESKAQKGERLMRKIVARIQQLHLFRALSRWRENATESARRRRLTTRAVYRLKHRAVVMVFESWSKHTRQIVAQRKKLTKVFKLASHRVEKGAFTRWYEQAHTVAEGRQVASRVVRKLLNSSLSRAWTVWVEQVEMGNELRATAGRVLGIMLNRNLAAAFQAWVEHWQQVKHGTQVAWRCVQRLMFRGLFMCFEAWQSFLVDEREGRAKAEQDRKAKERLETQQSETRVLRDRVMQLEMELESIRQILEWRAGEEYLRLVKASLGYVPPGWDGGVGRNFKGKKKRIPSNRVWDDRNDTRELSRAYIASVKQESASWQSSSGSHLRYAAAVSPQFDRDSVDASTQGVHFVVTPGSKGSPGALMTTHVVQKSRKNASMIRSPNKSSVGVSDTFVLSPD